MCVHVNSVCSKDKMHPVLKIIVCESSMCIKKNQGIRDNETKQKGSKRNSSIIETVNCHKAAAEGIKTPVL